MEDDENELLTLELRVKREGVLDRDAALALIERVRTLSGEYTRGYDLGYLDGHDDASDDVAL
jgi:hypothetical protein